MFGYHGQYLWVNLSDGSSRVEPIAESTLRKSVGGVGLAVELLAKETEAGVDPLSVEGATAITFSPLVGTPLTTSAKFCVAGKSPLTQRFNDALASSTFAIRGKRTGYDAILLTGRCQFPSVLLIDESGVRLEPAEGLWGMTIPDANARLEAEYGSDWAFGVIGPAGERMVRFATISFSGRHAGRGGLGAVWGSKNLKAVGVRGQKRVTVAKPEEVVRLAKDLSQRSFGPATAKYRELGTVSNLLTFNRLNALPTRNFQQGHFEAAEAVSGEALHEAHAVVRKSCAACTIGCEHLFQLGDKKKGVRLEYESLFALGPLCGVSDRDAVLTAAQFCDDIGLDTISTGATVAFAMECSEKGLLPERYRFGDADTLLTLIQTIATRQGRGDLLSNGTRAAAEMIGQGADQFAPHVKGLELPGYEPRALQTMALGLAVGTRGADHNRSGAYEVDFSPGVDRRKVTRQAVHKAIETEDKAALIDSLILCKFLRGVFSDIWGESAELLQAVTGWDLSADELRRSACRTITARKLFNIREGWTPAEDTLPQRFLAEPLPDGSVDGTRLPADRLQEMVREYNQARGWGSDGWVSVEVASRFELEPACQVV